MTIIKSVKYDHPPPRYLLYHKCYRLELYSILWKGLKRPGKGELHPKLTPFTPYEKG